MSTRRRYLLLMAVLGAGAVAFPAVAGSETTPVIKAVNLPLGYGHEWSPHQVAVAPEGEVELSNPTGSTPHGVEWVGGPSTGSGIAKPVCDASVPVGTTSAASGIEWSGKCKFTQSGTYTFYCTVHGPEMTATIDVVIPGAPLVTTGTASSVGESGATLNGTVNAQEEPTKYFFNYGTSASYGSKTSEQPAEEGNVAKPVSQLVSSLLPGTTYHYQLVAKNASGTTPGEDKTFTTSLPPGPPTATTGTAGSVGESEATLKGTVNPDGLASTYFYEWGTSTGYGQTTAELSAGSDHLSHAVSSTLTGLVEGTVYHFRLVAKNASAPGTVHGLDGTFTTGSPAPPPAPSPSPQPPASTPPPAPLPQAPAIVTPTLGGLPTGSPLLGGPSLSSSQHGSSVRGSLQVSSAGAGGRLEVDLLAKGSLLAKTQHSGSALVRVGSLLRASLGSGKLSFVVALGASGKRALARHHRLALTVRIVLTPTKGKALTLTRSVVLRS